MPASESLQQYAAALGASGVALGAFGAHALKDSLTKGNHTETWRTAVAYQLFHATALLGVSALAATRNSSSGAAGDDKNDGQLLLLKAGQCMAFGTLLFSGSLYGLSLSIGPKKILGPTTPIGGLLMISGWVMLGMASGGGSSSSGKDKK